VRGGMRAHGLPDRLLRPGGRRDRVVVPVLLSRDQKTERRDGNK
jgi:hypothetical protein